MLPPDGDLDSMEAYLRSLPQSDDPRLFGLHPNASVALNKQEGRRILDAVLSLQPRVAASAAGGAAAVAAAPAPAAGQPHAAAAKALAAAAVPAPPAAADVAGRPVSEEGLLAARLDEMLRGLPAPLDRARASALHDPFAPLPGGGVNALGTVLGHEIGRWAGRRSHKRRHAGRRGVVRRALFLSLLRVHFCVLWQVPLYATNTLPYMSWCVNTTTAGTTRCWPRCLRRWQRCRALCGGWRS